MVERVDTRNPFPYNPHHIQTPDNPMNHRFDPLRSAAWRDSIERRRRASARLRLTLVAGAIITLLTLLYAGLYTVFAGV